MLRYSFLTRSVPPSISRSTLAGSSVFQNFGTERPVDSSQMADLYYAPAYMKIRRPNLGNYKDHVNKVKRSLYHQADAARVSLGMPRRNIVKDVFGDEKKKKKQG